MYCPNCGKEIDNNAIVCPECGAATTKFYGQGNQPNVVINNTIENKNINEINGMISPKSKTVTLLLAIFLGTLGVHRFYVGKFGTGIIWMLTLGVGMFGWVFDIMSILTGHFKDKNGFVIIN